ncbi:hypothetical protein K1719_017572 [Acacia pycnantha]|nr:hypothetical protein K1719_017572 [Acacia pycnantha]
MEMDTKVILPHLLEAHVEAKDQNQNALGEETLRCIIGNPQGHFLKQEACKNFDMTFEGFYQRTPHGRFAHFVEKSAILEAIPEDSEAVHILDFDLGEGVQLNHHKFQLLSKDKDGRKFCSQIKTQI